MLSQHDILQGIIASSLAQNLSQGPQYVSLRPPSRPHALAPATDAGDPRPCRCPQAPLMKRRMALGCLGSPGHSTAQHPCNDHSAGSPEAVLTLEVWSCAMCAPGAGWCEKESLHGSKALRWTCDRPCNLPPMEIWMPTGCPQDCCRSTSSPSCQVVTVCERGFQFSIRGESSSSVAWYALCAAQQPSQCRPRQQTYPV